MILGLILFLAVAIVIFYVFNRGHAPEKWPLDADKLHIDDNSDRAEAVILHSKTGPFTVERNWPRPRISPKEVLVKVHAIGLNPIDWKCVAFGFGIHSVPWICGREASGVIEEIGLEVHGFQKGDRVFVTSTNYRDNRTSAFQQYTVASPFNIGRLPDWLTFEDGATLGVGSIAAAAALFDGLAIPRLPQGTNVSNFLSADAIEKPWVLIWGGSCVTGMMAIQFAKACDLRVLAVASLKNTSYLRELGADLVVDRHQPEEAISTARSLEISLAIDCVGQETATLASRALRRGGKLVYLVKGPRKETAEANDVTATDILIKRFHEDATYGQSLVDYISHGLSSRRVRPVRHEVIPGGLHGLNAGLEKLRSETVSGTKLVIQVRH